MSRIEDEAGPAMERHLERFVEEGNKMLRRVAHQHIVNARILARERLKHPGQYLESMTHEAEKLLIRVINFHRAARVIEYGSKIHKIRAKTRRVLKFFKEGEIKFRKAIIHPGTASLFIMLDSARRTIPYFEEQCNKLWEALKTG